MNPDCRDGKHRSCSGQGWDEEKDQPAGCCCPCHDPNHDHVHVNPGALQWGEEPLEGVVVTEGERIRPARCDRCTMGACQRCLGYKFSYMSLRREPCECECQVQQVAPPTPPTFHRGGWVEFVREANDGSPV